MTKNLMVIIIVAILCVTGLEIAAMYRGMKGAALTSTIGAVIGVPTWFVSKYLSKRNHQDE